jgi:Tol biopolymer transport system component
MNTHDPIPEARLTAGLSELAGPSTPGLRDDILAATARTRQRPAWSYPERWLPMAVITRPAVAPSVRPLWLLLIALLIAALAVGGAIVGAGLLRSEAAIPMGDEAVFAFSSVAADAETPQHVMTIGADGTDVRQLTSPDGTVWRAPQFSADGTRIAVRGWKAGTETIVVMDAGGGDPIMIASFATPNMDCIDRWEVAWSPDSSALAYATRQGCTASSRVEIARADGTSPPVSLLADDLAATSPSWSPDGTQIAFVTQSGDLYVVPASLPEAFVGDLTPHQIAASLGSVSGHPVWSPDGSEVAVTITTSGEAIDGSIYAVKADDSSYHKVIEGAYAPDWSPDGRSLSFARTVDPSEYWNDRPCTVRFGTVGREGTGERLLDQLGDGCDFPAQFSPDGTLLAALLIASTPEQPELAFHLGFVPVDGVTPPVIVQDSQGGSWQPVAAPLPPAPPSPPASTTP